VLLDGHMRLKALIELGRTEVFCLVANDDDAFTYNDKVTLSNAGRLAELGLILPMLVQRLYIRRLGVGEVPFLDGYNSLENVFEQVSGNNEEKLITTQSSFFVICSLNSAVIACS
jgi:hypothetical protein